LYKDFIIAASKAYGEALVANEQLRELIKAGTGVDPLKDFAEAVREERRQFAHI
jgi:hypothetical protein